MGRAEDLAAIELLAPWTQERFRSDLAGLRDSTAEKARRSAPTPGCWRVWPRRSRG